MTARTDALPQSWVTLRRFLLDLVPPGRPAGPWRALFPRSWGARVAFLVLGACFVTYLGSWVRGHAGMLFDPNLQTDDARTALYVFHRYGPERALADDPVAQEMMGFTPPALRALYCVFVKATNLFVAMKLVQGVAFLLILAAGVHLARHRRSGFAAGALLVFFILHTRGLMSGTVGGMTRGFVTPILALWTAGVLSGSERMRYVGVLCGALTHPSVMALLLATEGILALGAGLRRRVWPLARARLSRYLALVALCLLCAVPYSLDQAARVGRTFTFAEAQAEGVLGPKGRARHLPFGDPAPSAVRRFLQIFAADEPKVAGRPGLEMGTPVPEWHAAWVRSEGAGPVIVFALLLCAGLIRVAPLPRAVMALVSASFIMYFVARLVAFRMYAPERIYQYGMPAAALLLTVAVLGHLAPRIGRDRRTAIRCLVAAAIMLLSVAFTGDGIVPRQGVSLDRRGAADLYDFVSELPPSVRIAAHPLDGDDLPLWCGRATVVGFETMQPWWPRHWFAAKKRAIDTIAALYAAKREDVLAYCNANGVTHLLLRHDRYRGDFRKRAGLFEPLDAHIALVLGGVEQGDLVLAAPPADAVVFRNRAFSVVDVARLRAAWGRT
jgi:hypothetical protein